jgi:hypothetical protein
MGNLTLGQRLIVVGVLAVFDLVLLGVLLVGPHLFVRALAALGLFITMPMTIRFGSL